MSDPQTPGFVDYVDPRVFSVDPETVIEDEGGEVSDAGDRAPEGLRFVPTADCQSGDPLLIVGYEVSGTTAVCRVDRAQARPGGLTPAEPTHVRVFGRSTSRRTGHVQASGSLARRAWMDPKTCPCPT